MATLDPRRYLVVDDEEIVLHPLPAECRRTAERGVLVPLATDVVHVGRGPAAHIMLDDGTVSGRHAVFAQRDGRTIVLDDHSLNGVLVNGERVTEATLSDGDTIALGHVRLRFVERG